MASCSSDAFIESTGVVIVGAGIAGLGAALTLEQSNYKDYILVEAQSQIGGRICSIPWYDGWLEKGAQFLHGTGSSLAKLTKEKNLLSDIEISEGQGLYLREDGTIVEPKLVIEIDDFIKDVLENCEKYARMNEIECTAMEDTIGTVLRNRFNKYLKVKDDSLGLRDIKEELFDWNVRFLAIDNACSLLDELSVKSWGKFEAVSGPEYSIFESHYSSITEFIAEELTNKNIRLNCPVKKIEWNKQVNSNNMKPVIVSLQGNKKIAANCAIVTCSLGFLKENHSKLFSPPLPIRLTKAIQSMGFGLINKVFLDFDEPWWEPHTKGFQFLWKVDNDDYSNNSIKNKIAPWTRDLTGFDVLQNHKTILLGWVGRKGAQIVETLSEEQIIKDCAELFRYFLKNDNVPEASKCLRTCWGSNQFVRGSYCHITKKCDIADVSPATLAEPVWGKISNSQKNDCLPILMLAGEATHENHYSTTHGAYESGVKQAQIFLRCHFNQQ